MSPVSSGNAAPRQGCVSALTSALRTSALAMAKSAITMKAQAVSVTKRERDPTL